MRFSVPKFRAGRRARAVAILGVTAVVAALLSVVGTAATATADSGTASVSGTVTDSSTSAPISGAYVQIESQDQSFVNYVQTGDDGTYTMPGLDAGSYTLQFSSPDGGNYITQCWQVSSCNDPSTYVYFTVADGQALTGYDAALVDGASISGTVDGSDNPGVGLEGISVQAQSNDGSFGFATTDDNGNYTITGLAPDTYQINFQGSGNYLTQWWQNSPYAEHATNITVASGDTVTDINATLATGATISGTVTDPSGNPLANVNVNASTADGSGNGFATTDENGDYSIEGLIPGKYIVQFQPTEGSVVEQYWNDQPTSDTANPVNVAAGATVTGIDAQLAAGATISGTVTTAAGPLANASVSAVPTNGDPNGGASATTDASGNYTVIGLANGSYTVEFAGPDGKNLATQWWNNAATQQDATIVTTSVAAPATGIDAMMSKGASIAGHVWAPGAAGSPKVGVADASVGIFNTETGQEVAGAGTDQNGRYFVNDLPAGTYSVQYVTGGRNGIVASEWWGGTFIQTGAKTLTLAGGQARTGVSQRLIVGSPISGTITDGNSPATDGAVEIDIWSSDQVIGDQNEPPFETITDASGNYTLPNMGPGKYTIQFASLDPHFNSEWWNNKPTQAKANAVTVTRNVAVTGIDATLTPVVITPGTPTITGKARVGETLTAHPGNWKPSNVTFSYQWLDNGQPIADATAVAYVPTASEVGDTISVAVTGTTVAYESQGLSETVDSTSTNPIKGPSNLQ